MSEQFRDIRERLGLSVQEMASRAGLSVSFLSNFEAGKSGKLQVRTRRAITKAYGLDPLSVEPAQEAQPASSQTG